MAPQFDVEPAQLRLVKEILKRHLPGREVKAFGSRVTGNAKRFSDLDLVIMGEEPISPRQRVDLVDAFDESDLPFKVDLVEWAAASPSFRKIIERDAVALPV